MITTYAFRWTNFVAVLHSSLLLLKCTEAGFGVYHDFDGIHRTNVWKSKRTNGRLRERYLDDNISKEEYLRNLAADALLKTTPFMNYDATENAKFKTAEQISKKYLRLLDNDIDRKRLSTLILGTTVMMRKYMYLLESYEKEHFGERVLSFDDKRTVRRLIDLHINDDATHKNEMKRVHWPSDPICRLSYEYSLPKFLCDILVTQYGINETLEIAKTSNLPGPITLRRNSLKIDDDDNFIQTLADLDGMVCSKLDGLMGCFQLDIDHSKTSIWGSESWKQGLFEVQDMGSQLIVKATDVKVDEIVVDYCAGNGGKSLALAAMLQLGVDNAGSGRGHLFAHDVVPLRLKQLIGSLKRTGADRSRISAVCSIDQIEKSSGSVEFISISDTDILTSFPSELAADVVLVDAPCSSVGVLRRRPSQRWIISEDEILHTLPRLQKEILYEASKLVRKGGRLIYATCSIVPSENQHVAQWFELLSRNKTEWKPWDFDEDTWTNFGFRAGKPNWRVILPVTNRCDGFFIARWTKI